jgi:hypothetical protein
MPFGAVEGLKLAGLLSKTAGPVLAPLLTAGKDGIITDAAAKAIAQALADDLNVDASVQLIQRLVAQTTAKGVGVLGEPKVFDEHFAANYGDLVALLAVVVRVNFSGFFSGLGAMMPAPSQPAV